MAQLGNNRAAHSIVLANEKGGTGKSTTAVHIAVALAYRGAKVAAIDLDPRQRTMTRYFENRAETMARRGIDLTGVSSEVVDSRSPDDLDEVARRLKADHDFVIFDTPGRDDPLARHAAAEADTLVTPMNDSFVDFDLIGQVEGETFKVRRLSFYAELIWETRLKRSRATLEDNRRELDWVLVRNRTSHIEARNMHRIESALKELSERVGFRVTKGLSERVIYRELFPSGLTLLDKGHLGDLGTSHLVARQELRSLIKALRLPDIRGSSGPDAGPEADRNESLAHGSGEQRGLDSLTPRQLSLRQPEQPQAAPSHSLASQSAPTQPAHPEPNSGAAPQAEDGAAQEPRRPQEYA